MGRKKKEIVWHKKKGRFIDTPLTTSQSGRGNGAAASTPSAMDRRQRFAKSLSEQIKKAACQSSDDS